MKASQSWIFKHKPRKFTDLVFSTDVHLKLLQILREKKDSTRIHICGRAGLGKTTLIQAVATALKYNIIEITDENISDAKNIVKQKNHTLNNQKNLILIDESVVDKAYSLINIVKTSELPIIITSCDLFIKEIELIKVEKPTFSNILEISKRILKKENIRQDNKAIFKIAECSNFDIRATLNYLQLHSKNLDSSIFTRIHEKFVSYNFFSICKEIIDKKLKLATIESYYNKKMAFLCLSSLIETSNNFKNSLESVIAYSDAEILPENYKFISLASLNNKKFTIVYKKEESLPIANQNKQFDAKMYLDNYKKTDLSERNVNHLLEIDQIYKLNIKEAFDLRIKKPEEIEALLKLKYKYKQGSSCPVRRDICILDLFK